jgi:hypothetical protein
MDPEDESYRRGSAAHMVGAAGRGNVSIALSDVLKDWPLVTSPNSMLERGMKGSPHGWESNGTVPSLGMSWIPDPLFLAALLSRIDRDPISSCIDDTPENDVGKTGSGPETLS